MATPDKRLQRPRTEVADILRMHGAAYRAKHAGHLDWPKLKVMDAITACRTSALGGHVDVCEDCGTARISFNSCRNRHCPKCQGQARFAWLEARQAELLPVSYFHLVFTLPPKIAEIAYQNKSLVYGILFKASHQAISALALNPKRLGAKAGGISVLHIWGQTLTFHPHIHCVIPGGGLSPDGTRWISSRCDFFLPVKPLGQLFRRRFLELLSKAFEKGKLKFFGKLAPFSDPRAFAARIKAMGRINWVVYAKKPFGGPEQVLKYLSRYTHRVAIAGSRIVSLDKDQVTFEWKDYRDGGKKKLMKLKPDEFIRRFLLHVLPPGFHRIRQFGFLSNCHRSHNLEVVRKHLNIEPVEAPSPPEAPP
jgi:hypothetical protein